MKRIEKAGDVLIKGHSHYLFESALVYTSVLKRIRLKDWKCHLKSKERRKPMEEVKKLPVAERVEKKTMGMTKYLLNNTFKLILW